LAQRLNLPAVIGHRGAAARSPENTLAGFRLAKSLGCAWVEFDVRLTADGLPVICHDDTLDHTTDSHGRISKLPLAAIRQADAGSWFEASYAGEHVPTLEEALSCCRELGLGTNVEIKAEHGRGPATAQAVAACLDRLAGKLPPILVSSFLADAVAEAAAAMPLVPRGMLWRQIPRGWQAIAARLGCATIHCGHAALSEEVAAAVTTAAYPLLAYTVNDPARAAQLYSWGVASVFSDVPDIIIAAAAEDRVGRT
jgi:glycerophosphoryl diester phosphodiesterase